MTTLDGPLSTEPVLSPIPAHRPHRVPAEDRGSHRGAAVLLLVLLSVYLAVTFVQV